MAIPISLRTDNEAIRDLWNIPGIGGLLVITLVAFGPPTVLTLMTATVATLFGARHLFFQGFLEITPLYIFVACTGVMLWNLWLSKYRKIRIGILFMPAWAFGIMGMVLAPIAHFAGWE
jgi:hypothetical protein